MLPRFSRLLIRTQIYIPRTPNRNSLHENARLLPPFHVSNHVDPSPDIDFAALDRLEGMFDIHVRGFWGAGGRVAVPEAEGRGRNYIFIDALRLSAMFKDVGK